MKIARKFISGVNVYPQISSPINKLMGYFQTSFQEVLPFHFLLDIASPRIACIYREVLFATIFFYSGEISPLLNLRLAKI